MPSDQKKDNDHYHNAIYLLNIFEQAGYPSRLVGGCVRDQQMNLTPKDYDIATTARPEQTLKILKKHKIKGLPIGLEHGTVTAVLSTGSFEITTLRTDITTDGRRAKVEFGTDFKKDAERRDFTINAMSQDKEGKLYDYFSGVQHIQKKRISFVGSPRERIEEDYLRILRYFRFASRFNLQGTKETEDAIAEKKEGLKSISGERKLKELMGLLETAEPYRILRKALELGVMSYILPDHNFSVDKGQKRSFTIIEQLKSNKQTFDPIYSLLALVLEGYFLPVKSNFSKDPIDHLFHYLKLSKSQKKFLESMIFAYYQLGEDFQDNNDYFNFIDQLENGSTVDPFKGFPYSFFKIVAAHLQDLDRLKNLDEAFAVEKKIGHLRTADLPLKTKEIIQVSGIPPGPELGRLLVELKKSFRNEVWSTQEEGKKYIRSWQAK